MADSAMGTAPVPATATVPTADGPPLAWEQALEALAGARTFWLSTVRPGGAPHCAPVLAVVVDGAVHVAAGPATRKARNLAADARCTVGASGGGLDLVVEGAADPVTGPGELDAVARAYTAAYGWAPEPRDGALWAEGAPSAGPPPYAVYRVAASSAFAFPTDGASTPTRWLFAAPG
ncbi:pyridoxamine 5'-phosphate oxidase family protein [Nocardiopsis coralliicola]